MYDNAGRHPLNDNGFSSTSELFTIPASGGEPTRLKDDRSNESQPSYSPDGTKIAFHSGETAWIVGGDGGSATRLPLPGTCCAGFTPRWSPDGSTIAFTRFDRNWRATSDMLGSTSSLGVVDVMAYDLRTGKVSSVGGVRMATDYNVPVWLPSGDGLLLQTVRRNVDS